MDYKAFWEDITVVAFNPFIEKILALREITQLCRCVCYTSQEILTQHEAFQNIMSQHELLQSLHFQTDSSLSSSEIMNWFQVFLALEVQSNRQVQIAQTYFNLLSPASK